MKSGMFPVCQYNSRYFTLVLSFNPYSNPIEFILVIPSISQVGKLRSGVINSLHKVTHILVSGRVRIQHRLFNSWISTLNLIMLPWIFGKNLTVQSFQIFVPQHSEWGSDIWILSATELAGAPMPISLWQRAAFSY